MIQYSFPFVLLLIPVLLGIWYLFFRERFGYVPANRIMWAYLKTPLELWWLWMIRAVLVTTIVSTLARPSITHTAKTEVKVPQDISIVLDLSLSMLAEDVSPNRIEAAKRILRNFTLTRKDDRIGLIVFAGKPFVSVPFSTDTSAILSVISGLSPYSIRQDIPGLSGTNIGDAILLAMMQASGSTSPHQSIVLLTDGKANIGIDPRVAVEELKQKNIHIYTVALGSAIWWELAYTDLSGKKTFFYDGSGNTLKSEIDTKLLENLSQVTGWASFTAENSTELETAFRNIDSTLPDTQQTKVSTKKIDMMPLLILSVIILIFLERAYLLWIVKTYRLK